MNNIAQTFNKKKVFLTLFLLLNFLFFHPGLKAQNCSPEAQYDVKVVQGEIVFTAQMPNIPGATYTWGWETADGDMGDGDDVGTTLTLSKDKFSLSAVSYVRLLVATSFNQYQCNRDIYAGDSWEVAGFGTDIMGCTVGFIPAPPFGNVLSETWNYGDGSPEDCNTNTPVHNFPETGTYNVCHSIVTVLPTTPFAIRIYCWCEDVNVECEGNTFTCDFDVMEQDDCCRLTLNFESEFQDGEHTWDFGDGAISTEVNPAHQYNNISTYQDATPSVEIIHTVTFEGITETCTLTYFFAEQAIHVGIAGGQTLMTTVTSSISGDLLFPGANVNGATIHIDGILIADRFFFAFLNNTVCMIPESGINVTNPLGTFVTTVFNFSTFTNKGGCAIWRGIQQFDNTTTSFFTTTIKDAYIGIEKVGDQDATTIVESCPFENNFVSIYINGYTSTAINDNTFSFAGILDPIGNVPEVFPEPQAWLVQEYDVQRAFTGIHVRNSFINFFNGNYRKQLQHPNLINATTEMSNFNTAYTSESGGELHEISQQIAALYTISSTDKNTLQSNQSQIQSRLDLIIVIDQDLAAGNGNVSNLLTQRLNHINQINTLRQQNANIRNTNINNRISGAASILSSNSSINTSADYDSNEKVIKDILLLTEVQNQMPTLVQKATIKGIAEMCALEGGLAVYQARALYETWTGEQIEDNGCTQGGNKSDEEDVIKNEIFHVSPNPANHSIQLTLPEAGEDLSFTLEVTSLTGQSLSSHYIPANSVFYHLDVNQIPNGIYFLQLTNKDSLFKSTKVIIQH